ncbi:hypothetical protein [Kitasatospora viridis]|uniref:Uncharacterized protein n=1 Tax=Kitasatospora viridis TaxID=281105 RepID=A0A561T6I7_9ACTN|nr:hypothetical protein [Kitasatospora viridis]TWF82736.1 hypothetical protein FHX73_14218 [Kitasatospora viridis]
MSRLRTVLDRHEPLWRRWLPRVFCLAALLLVPWIVTLGLNVRGHFGKRNLSNSWVWLDIVEACTLLLLAVLVHRRNRYTSPIASAAAMLLGADAFFDLWSARRGEPYFVAEVMAYCAELPSALLLAVLSWYSLNWAAVPEHHRPG